MFLNEYFYIEGTARLAELAAPIWPVMTRQIGGSGFAITFSFSEHVYRASIY